MHKPGKQKDFAAIVGVSEAAVSGYMDRGMLVAGAAMGQWLAAYCSHLREQAAGRASEGGLDLGTERARLAKEQADKIALANAVTRGELAPRELMTQVLAKAGARVAGIFDGIVPALRRRNSGLSVAELDLVAGEVAKARNLCASMSLADMDEKEDADDTDAELDSLTD